VKVILIKDDTSSSRPICLSGNKFFIACLAGLIALPIALGLLSYWVSASIDRSLNPFTNPEYRIAVESRVNGQQQEILKTREYVRQHIDVLGRRIGIWHRP